MKHYVIGQEIQGNRTYDICYSEETRIEKIKILPEREREADRMSCIHTFKKMLRKIDMFH